MISALQPTTVKQTTVASIMARLKTETSPAHRQLEKSLCFKRLFAVDYEINEYAKLLGYFYGYFSQMEPLMFMDLPAEHENCLKYRTKVHLLH